MRRTLGKENIRFQQISSRIKSEASVRQKLKKSTYKKIEKIQDIVGLRIVLYLAEDVEKTVSAIFHQLRNSCELTEKEQFSENSYNATHIILKPRDNKIFGIDLTNYKKLQCEIQITTTIFHTWSEISHKVLYKKEESLSAFAPVYFSQIEDELGAIVKEHLWPASRRLSSLNSLYIKIQNAQRLFSKEVLEAIESKGSSRQIGHHAAYIKEALQSMIIDLPNDIDLVRWAHALDERQPEAKASQYPYLSANLLEIIFFHRFLEPEFTFYFLLEKCFSKNVYLAKTAKENITNWFSPKFVTNPKIGFGHFYFLIAEIDRFKASEVTAVFETIKDSYGNMFKLSFMESKASTAREISFGEKYFVYNKSLKDFRHKAINSLFKILVKVDHNKKSEVLKILFSVANFDARNINKEIVAMVKSEIRFISKKLATLIVKLSLEERRSLYCRINQIRNIEFRKQARRLQQTIRTSQDFQDYYQFTLLPYDLGYQKFEQNTVKLEKAVLRLAVGIKRSDYNLWAKKLIRFNEELKTSKSERAFVISRFLATAAKENPDFAAWMVEHYNDFTTEFLFPIWNELHKKSDGKVVKQLISSKIGSKGTRLQAIGLAFSSGNADSRIISKYLKYANTATELVELIKLLCFNKNHPLRNEFFVKSLEKLNSLKICGWLIYFRNGFADQVPELSKGQIEILLNNVVYERGQTYWIEEVLCEVSKIDVSYVLFFFDLVLNNSDARIEIHSLRYDINRVLVTSPEDITAVISWGWNKILKGESEKWKVLSILRTLLPVLSKELTQFIYDSFDQVSNNLDHVLSLLSEYSGAYGIDEIVLKIVDLNQLDESKIGTLYSLFERHNEVVTGEFGFAERIKAIIVRLSTLTNLSQKQENFRKSALAYYNNRLSRELKIANNSISAMDLEFERSRSLETKIKT